MSPDNKHVHRELKLGMKGPDVRELQQGLNQIFAHWKLEHHTAVDGAYGHHTKKSVKMAMKITGFSKSAIGKMVHGGLSQYDQQVLRGSKNRTRFMRIRTRLRRRQIRQLRRKLSDTGSYGKDGDEWGVWKAPSGRVWRVAGWMVGLRVGPNGKKVNWLRKFHEMGWGGELYSGGRTPAESVAACYHICGRPSCPGLCAGESSNHSKTGPPNWGAIDVVDPTTFQRCNDAAGGPFHNHLPLDPNHRSPTGY